MQLYIICKWKIGGEQLGVSFFPEKRLLANIYKINLYLTSISFFNFEYLPANNISAVTFQCHYGKRNEMRSPFAALKTVIMSLKHTTKNESSALMIF